MKTPIVNVFLSLMLSGCSITYIDHHGALHVVGISHVVISPYKRDGEARIVNVATAGIALLREDMATSVSVGYSKEGVASIPANSCAVIPSALWSASSKGLRYDIN
jgi:hypothetical protein